MREVIHRNVDVFDFWRALIYRLLVIDLKISRWSILNSLWTRAIGHVTTWAFIIVWLTTRTVKCYLQDASILWHKHSKKRRYSSNKLKSQVVCQVGQDLLGQLAAQWIQPWIDGCTSFVKFSEHRGKNALELENIGRTVPQTQKIITQRLEEQLIH